MRYAASVPTETLDGVRDIDAPGLIRRLYDAGAIVSELNSTLGVASRLLLISIPEDDVRAAACRRVIDDWHQAEPIDPE